MNSLVFPRPKIDSSLQIEDAELQKCPRCLAMANVSLISWAIKPRDCNLSWAGFSFLTDTDKDSSKPDHLAFAYNLSFCAEVCLSAQVYVSCATYLLNKISPTFILQRISPPSGNYGLVIFRRFVNFGPFCGPFLLSVVKNAKHEKVFDINFCNQSKNHSIHTWVPKMRFPKMYIFGAQIE